MNQTETAHLVERIIQTWPTGPKGRIWTEVLNELPDTERANIAYIKLRAESEHAPTCARFLAMYHATAPSPEFWPEPREPRDTPEAISFTEYIGRLTTRANRGDPEAINELETWRRWGNPTGPHRRRRRIP